MENSGAPPDLAAAMQGENGESSEEQEAAAANAQSSNSSQSNPFAAADPSAQAGQNGFPGGLPPGMAGMPGDGQSTTLSPKEQGKLFSPQSLSESIWEQLRGPKSQEQQQKEMQQQQSVQQRIAAARQDAEMMKERQKAEDKQNFMQAAQMKQEIRTITGKFSPGSVVTSQTTSGDRSELALLAEAIKSAQDSKRREQQRRQQAAMAPKSPQKGPQAEGGEVGGGKGSMVDRMISGNEQPPSGMKEDADSIQRQAEQTMGE